MAGAETPAALGAGLVVTGIAVGLVWWTDLGQGADFATFFGSLPPALAVAILGSAGSAAAAFLAARHDVALWPDTGTLRRPALVAALVAVFGAAAIATDMALGYPRDINVPLPWSLVFYPVMAAVAETAFHLVPLALILAVLPRGGQPGPGTFALVASIEPAFQVRSALAAAEFSALDVFTALNVLAINALLLTVLWRHGVVAAYLVRLWYYAIWHILWGQARLEILF